MLSIFTTSARTGTYAPWILTSVALALAFPGERPDAAFWAAAGLMALGVCLHVTERHEHEHTHPHRHAALVHSHPHYPDLHHRHSH